MTRWLFIGSVYPKIWEAKFGVGSSPTIDVQRSLLASIAGMGWRPDAILTTPPIRLFPRDHLQCFPKDLDGEIGGLPGVPLISLGSTNLEPFKTLSIARALRRTLKRWCQEVLSAGDSPRVLVYNLGPTHEQGGFLAAVCRSLKLPVIPFVTDLDFAGKGWASPSTWRFHWQVRLLQKAERLVALNPRVLEDFGEGRPTLHVPGIVPDRGFFDKLLQLPTKKATAEGTTFLYTGSLNRPRGIIRLLDAFQSLAEENVRLLITGRGPEEERVREQAAQFSNIDFRGFLSSEEERLRVFEEADVLVNPHEIESPKARYLFPSKLAEYLASGRLVVSSQMPGMSEFPLEEMVLASSDSVETLAGALKSACLLTSDERLRRAEHAREWASGAFSWAAVGRSLLSFMGEDGRVGELNVS